MSNVKLVNVNSLDDLLGLDPPKAKSSPFEFGDLYAIGASFRSSTAVRKTKPPKARTGENSSRTKAGDEKEIKESLFYGSLKSRRTIRAEQQKLKTESVLADEALSENVSGHLVEPKKDTEPILKTEQEESSDKESGLRGFPFS